MSRTVRKFKNTKYGMFTNTLKMTAFESDDIKGYRVVPVGTITLTTKAGKNKFSVSLSGLVSPAHEQQITKEYMDRLIKLTRDSNSPRGPNRSYRKNRENQFRNSNREAIHKVYKFGEFADYFNKGPKSAAWDWY
jgi:hypothetical protein